MKKTFTLLFVFAIISSCVARISTTFSPAQGEMPKNLNSLPLHKEIDVNWNKPSTIDLRGIKDEVSWIYTPDLTDCFGYDEPRPFSVISNDKLISSRLIISFMPTIWSDEEDEVIQLIEFPTLQCIGIKDITVDHGRAFHLYNNDLFTIPDNVKMQVGKITREELLAELETSGTKNEFEDWSTEKKVWEGYISKYQQGDFIKAENNRFGTYPNTFYIELTFDGKRGAYIVNLCDCVIIGN